MRDLKMYADRCSGCLGQVVRRSENMQLGAHDRYLAALKHHAGERTSLLIAMSEQLAELQAACSRQLEALDVKHTKVHWSRGFK